MFRDPDDLFAPVVIGGIEFPAGDVIAALDCAGYTAVRKGRLRYLSWTKELALWPTHPPVKYLFERGAYEMGLEMLNNGLIATKEVGPVGCSSFDLLPQMGPLECVPMHRHYLTMNAVVLMPSPEKEESDDADHV